MCAEATSSMWMLHVHFQPILDCYRFLRPKNTVVVLCVWVFCVCLCLLCVCLTFQLQFTKPFESVCGSHSSTAAGQNVDKSKVSESERKKPKLKCRHHPSPPHVPRRQPTRAPGPPGNLRVRACLSPSDPARVHLPG